MSSLSEKIVSRFEEYGNLVIESRMWQAALFSSLMPILREIALRLFSQKTGYGLLKTLPTEIVAEICRNLGFEDLKNARFVDGKFNCIGQQILFRTLHVKINMQSFLYLQEISLDPMLAQLVRAIHYDGSIVSYPSAALPGWFVQDITAGLYPDEVDENALISNLSNEQLISFKRTGRNRFFGQDMLLRNGNAEAKFAECIRQFDGLREFEYSLTPRKYIIIEEVPLSLSRYGTVTRQILTEPHRDRRFEHESRFWTLLEATSRAERLRQIKAVCGRELRLWAFVMAMDFVEQAEDLLTTVEDLSLDFDFSGFEDKELDRIGKMLSRTTVMRSLSLSFEKSDNSYIYEWASLPMLINIDVAWPQLRNLALKGVASTEAGFCSLLLRFKTSLRELRLSDMSLEKPEVPDEHEIGSWISVIRFLGDLLMLEQFSVTGKFSNSVETIWMLGDSALELDWGYPSSQATSSDTLELGKDSLKSQIERFVIGQGPDPFLGAVDNERP